jgi:hypothetical protein
MIMEYDPSLEPVIDFYQVDPEEELTGEPGRLINDEPLDGHAVPAAAGRAFRVIYESTSGKGGGQEGTPIGVSGIVAFPPEPPPKGGWPVVTWAHGTVGSADKCAPSMDQYLTFASGDDPLHKLRTLNKEPHNLLSAFLEAGYLVAMTDYEGLGCYSNHPYLLGESEGRGILDVVPAARELAAREGHQTADGYSIVGHSQGGQAALFAAGMADRYGTAGNLLSVAALAPASNLRGDDVLVPDGENGLLKAYQSPTLKLVGDLGGFYVLFSNGVFGGNPGIDPDEIFRRAARIKYDDDFDKKARVELSADTFWMETIPSLGIFQPQRPGIGRPMTQAWLDYWKQVDDFTPDVLVPVPIRISQATGDQRVVPEKTQKLLGQLKLHDGRGPITQVFYDTLLHPDPDGFGAHFGLLVDDREIRRLVEWIRHPLDEDTELDGDAD